jgi:hypothetical protein
MTTRCAPSTPPTSKLQLGWLTSTKPFSTRQRSVVLTSTFQRIHICTESR